jgi:hypothetical protein
MRPEPPVFLEIGYIGISICDVKDQFAANDEEGIFAGSGPWLVDPVRLRLRVSSRMKSRSGTTSVA